MCSSKFLIQLCATVALHLSSVVPCHSRCTLDLLMARSFVEYRFSASFLCSCVAAKMTSLGSGLARVSISAFLFCCPHTGGGQGSEETRRFQWCCGPLRGDQCAGAVWGWVGGFPGPTAGCGLAASPLLSVWPRPSDWGWKPQFLPMKMGIVLDS